MGSSIGRVIERAVLPVAGGLLGGPVGAGIGGAISGASRGGGLKGALTGGALSYGGAKLLGGANEIDGASVGDAAGSGGASGSGITTPPNAGAMLGVPGGSEELFLGKGITPGQASGAIGGGSVGTGVAPGVTGGLGAFDLQNFNFSPAAMEALKVGGQALPSLTQSNLGSGLRLPNASGGSSGQGLRLPGAAPSAPASTAPGTAPPPAPSATGGGFVDNIIKQMKDNALGLGLIGGATMLSMGQQRQMPNMDQFNALGGEAAETARGLLAQYRSGQLSPGQQAGIDQLTQQTKNQITQYFSSIGQADSTAHSQALAQVDQQALQMKQQMLDSALTNGLNAIGVAQGPLATVAQYQLGQDQQLSQAFGNFAGAVGNLFGRQSGTQQPTQSEQKKLATQPVSSVQT